MFTNRIWDNMMINNKETRLESTWSSKKGLNLNVERSWSLELGVRSLGFEF